MENNQNHRTHFTRNELVIASMILNQGPVSCPQVIEETESTGSSIWQSIQRATDRGVLTPTDLEPMYVRRGSKPVYYDLSLGGLVLARDELAIVQVENLDDAIARKQRELRRKIK